MAGSADENHVDGTPAFISPEIAMEIQTALGSDVAMVLDECPPWPCEFDYAARSLEMTIRWAKRCKQWATENIQRLTLDPPPQGYGAASAQPRMKVPPADQCGNPCSLASAITASARS